MKILSASLAVVLLLTGCGSLNTANFPLRPQIQNRTIRQAYGLTVYIRYSSTMPLEALRAGGGVKALGLETDLIAGGVEAIGKVAEAYPKIVNSYATIRNSNAFSQVEILVKGAKGAEDLLAVKGLIDSLSKRPSMTP